MDFYQGKKILDEYAVKKRLRNSKQRDVILRIFLETTKHLTSEELYGLVKQKLPNIGIATIYRTLKLFCECKIAAELKFNREKSRYETLLYTKHHDHLICLKCGKLIEIYDDEIERLQKKLSKKNNFILKSHKLELYGFCKECQTG